MITLRERIKNLETLVNTLMSSIKSDIRVALPAIVTSFDAEKQTISCIPAIRELININGKVEYKDLPELKDVPISIPRAGNWAITLPIQIGDECMVIFQDLCMDGWWFRGGVQNWNDLRRHDLSDAIAVFSPWSQPNTISNYSTQFMEARSLDGSTKMSFQSGKVVLTGDLDINGKIHSTGTIISDIDVISGTISGKSHTHEYNPGPGSPTPTGVPQ